MVVMVLLRVPFALSVGKRCFYSEGAKTKTRQTDFGNLSDSYCPKQERELNFALLVNVWAKRLT